MNKVRNQVDGKWGGYRPGAGRPRVPRVTVLLTPELLVELHEQARQHGRSAEQHAAHLLTTALTAPLFQAQVVPASVPAQDAEQPQTQTAATGPRQLVLGNVDVTAPNHLSIRDDLRAGATLIETAPDVWMLKKADGTARQVHKKTIATLLDKKVLRINRLI